jgi:D-alanine-D-alanine ligase
MRPPRVLILYNELTLPPDHRDADSEHEVTFTVEHVAQALKAAGHRVSRLAVSRDAGALVAGVRRARPDVVFNLFEGLPDWGDTEAFAAGALEWLGVPYTGCPFQPLALARHKQLTKQLLRGAGLPTPDFVLIEELPAPPCPLAWPVIVKPSNQDASVGLDQGSVVTTQEALEQRVAYLLEQYGPPVLVEEYVPGREFNVALVEAPELRVLPLSEILFTEPAGSGFWPIVTYDAKWRPGTPEYEATPPVYAGDVPPRLKARLEELAKQAFRLLGCRDYARVDFRVRPPARPYILEVNPNPDFSPLAGLSGALAAAGLPWAEFAVGMVRRALARGRAATGAAANGRPAEILTQ